MCHHPRVQLKYSVPKLNQVKSPFMTLMFSFLNILIKVVIKGLILALMAALYSGVPPQCNVFHCNTTFNYELVMSGLFYCTGLPNKSGQRVYDLTDLEPITHKKKRQPKV